MTLEASTVKVPTGLTKRLVRCDDEGRFEVSSVGGFFANVAASAVTNVNANASSVTLLASNSNRKNALLHNDSTSKVRVKLGATASSTSFSFPLGPYETASISDFGSNYTGIIDAIWETAIGAMRITEMS